MYLFFVGVKESLFEGVKKSYGSEVLAAVTEVAQDHKDEVLKLAKVMMPHLQTVLARQRRDYGIDEERFPAQYPVEEQASNIDDTPVNNIAAERACGKIDYRLHKSKELSAVSRQNILQRCKDLRTGETSSFRGYREAAKLKGELELNWSKQMKTRLKEGSDEKRELALKQERKRLDGLESLKVIGGPFTSAEEVEFYLADLNPQNEKNKKQRMKKELQYARDTSTLLPKADPLFKIRKTELNGKSRDKNATEFGDALKAFLGKKTDRLEMEYDKFQKCLDSFAVTSN